MDTPLACIELSNVERTLLKIVLLFCQQMVANNVLPVTSDLGHILELIQRLACLEQEPVNEEEPKVINLILCSLLDIVRNVYTCIHTCINIYIILYYHILISI